MSAYICDDSLIATIALWATTDKIAAQEVANGLKRENVKSVNYRYKEKTRVTKCALGGADTQIDVLGVLDLIDCLEYQSCEHPDYKRGMLAVIKAHALRATA